MSPSRVAVVADSACDLPPDVAEAAGIRVVPLVVAFGTESLRDRTDLPPEAFWTVTGAHLGPGALGVAVVRAE